MVYLVRSTQYYAGAGASHFVIKFSLERDQDALQGQGLADERKTMIKMRDAADPFNAKKFIAAPVGPGTLNTTACIMTPYHELDLREVINQQAATTAEIRQIFQRLLRAVALMHGEGVVHRDLKPENILMQDKVTPYIIDLGLANNAGVTAGTRGYKAPEQAHSNIRGHSKCTGNRNVNGWDARLWDSYSLGVIFHEFRQAPGWCDELQNLAKALQMADSSKRLQVIDAIGHAFFDDLRDPKKPQLKQNDEELLFKPRQ